jgi:hypothetical protein
LRHNHDADVQINVNLPKQDLEDLIDKTTGSIITIIAVVTVAQIVKSIFTQRPA